MGLFEHLFLGWALRRQRAEVSAFIANLRAMDGEEIGALVVLATDARHNLEALGHQVSDPIVYFSRNPAFISTLNSSIRELQKLGKLQEAAALMVWLHTMRAGARLELRQLGRDLWREMARGFPYVGTSVAEVELLLGRKLQVGDALSFPKGLTPDPL